MKIIDIEKIFNKLSLQVRSTSHNYGWLTVNGKKILRVHYSHGRGDLPDKYNGLRNLDRVICYTWERKRGGPSGEFEEAASAVV
ncbi:MAG: hypothetical protein MUO26_11880 [Methanotrichaceae archaeon]|nr:hypothetical protein [Methanotrichaceae archaeon]